MSLLIPPARPVKKQRLANGSYGPALSTAALTSPSTSANAGRNIIVQFRTDGLSSDAIGGVISLPLNTTRAALEMIVNKLKAESGGGEDDDDEPLPYAFHVLMKSGSNPGDPAKRVPITSSLLSDLFDSKDASSSSAAAAISTEDVLTVICEPQAVFRVRPASRCSSTLSGHTAVILCCQFSPTGSFLATGSGDCSVRLWDLDTETAKCTLNGHVGHVLCVEWEPRERILASGGREGHVRLWDPKKGVTAFDTLKGHKQWITSLSWEPCHLNSTTPRLASSSKDGTVKIWQPSNSRLEFTLGGHTASVNVVRWSGEDIIYTASSDRTVRLWSGKDGKLIRVLSNHAHWVTTLSLSTDFVLRTGPYDFRRTEPKDDKDAMQKALDRYTQFTNKSPECAITGSDDNTLFLWPPSGSLNPKTPVARLTGHQKQVNHVAFSPDGRYIASAGFDNAVRLWDGKTGKFIVTFRGHVAPVYRVAWSSDSRNLISASKDSTLKIWDLKTHKIKMDLPGHEDEIYCVDFVASKVVSGGKDRVVKIWTS